MKIVSKFFFAFLLFLSMQLTYCDKFSQELEGLLTNSGPICFWGVAAPFLCGQRTEIQRLMSPETKKIYDTLSLEDKIRTKRLAEEIKQMPEYNDMAKLEKTDDNNMYQKKARAFIAIKTKVDIFLNECAQKTDNVNKCLALSVFLVELLQQHHTN